MEQVPIVRVERFRELAPSGDEAVTDLILLFLEEMRGQLSRLRDAIDRNAVAAVELIAHRCAGTSATCGADAVSAPLRTLEHMANDGTLDDAAPLVEAVGVAFARTEDFLAGYLAGLSAGRRNG